MPVGAVIIGIMSVIVAGAVPYMMLRSRTEDAKLNFYNNLFRSFQLDEDRDSATKDSTDHTEDSRAA